MSKLGSKDTTLKQFVHSHNKATRRFVAVVTLSFIIIVSYICITGSLGTYWWQKAAEEDWKICPNFYFDLGSNVGDSITNFILHNLTTIASSNSILKRFASSMGVNSADYCVYGFEGNPVFSEGLKSLERLLQSYTRKTKIYTQTVASDEDGMTQLYLDLVNEDHNFWGSSLNNHTKDILKSGSKAVDVVSIDFGKFLKQRLRDKRLISPPVPMVVVRMDIEGSEYRVLQRMFEEGLLCHYIDYLIVEFHEDSAPINSSISDTVAWFMQNTTRCQTKFIFKDMENDY
eukprot:jgi/Galph1/5436/GphlegSOOS_G4021.1